MKIEQTNVRDVVIYKVSGRIDSSTAEPFWQTASETLASGTVKFIIDCAVLEYISSAGLRVLLKIAKHVKPYNGIVCLCNMSQETKSVMDIAGILAFLKTYSTLEEALNHY